MKWSEMDYDAQCDALCMLIDPAEELTGDKDLLRLIRDKKLFQAAGRILTQHREAVRYILAAVDGIDPADVRINLLAMPGKIVELLKNEDLVQLFTLQLPGLGQIYSGGASAGTAGASGGAGTE